MVRGSGAWGNLHQGSKLPWNEGLLTTCAMYSAQLGRVAGARTTHTFDRALRNAEGFTLLA
jgi:hypothetical protein